MAKMLSDSHHQTTPVLMTSNDVTKNDVGLIDSWMNMHNYLQLCKYYIGRRRVDARGLNGP